MADEYEHVQKSALKLKGLDESSKKKKKKKKKEKERDLIKRLEQIASGTGDSAGSSDERASKMDPLTAAQKRFREVKERRESEQLLKKAEKTHKERIMDFNERLDSLTEHYDIPKVSWTK